MLSHDFSLFSCLELVLWPNPENVPCTLELCNQLLSVAGVLVSNCLVCGAHEQDMTHTKVKTGEATTPLGIRMPLAPSLFPRYPVQPHGKHSRNPVSHTHVWQVWCRALENGVSCKSFQALLLCPDCSGSTGMSGPWSLSHCCHGSHRSVLSLLPQD